MGADIRFPKRGIPTGDRGTIVGQIVTDAVAPLASTCTGTALTSGSLVTLTLPTTTLSAAAAVGATSVSLTSTAGYANGSIIRIAGAGQGGTYVGNSDLIAEITLAGSVASLFEPGTGVPLAVQTAVASGAVVMPGFLAGDYVRIVGGGAGGVDLDTLISTVSNTGTISIVGRPGLPTSVTGAAITRHYLVETDQIARRVVLERMTGTVQVDEWFDGCDLWQGKRVAASGAITYPAAGAMLVLSNWIVIPYDLLPESSSFQLTLMH